MHAPESARDMHAVQDDTMTDSALCYAAKRGMQSYMHARPMLVVRRTSCQTMSLDASLASSFEKLGLPVQNQQPCLDLVTGAQLGHKYGEIYRPRWAGCLSHTCAMYRVEWVESINFPTTTS